MPYMSMFILSGLDQNRERKARVKKLVYGLVKLFRESNKKIQSISTVSDNQQQVLKANNLPEYSLSLAISLLAHNCKIDSLKDEVTVKQIKDSLSLILDPLLDNPDGYQIAFLKRLLGIVKDSDDGLASTVLSHSKDTDQLNAANQLMSVNKKIQTICEIAIFLIHSKIAHNITKEYPYEIQLPVGYFKEKNTPDESTAAINLELETTLSTIEDTNKSASTSVVSSPSGRSRKRTSKEVFQSDDEDKNRIDENAESDVDKSSKNGSQKSKNAQKTHEVEKTSLIVDSISTITTAKVRATKKQKNDIPPSTDLEQPTKMPTRHSLRKK
jgi:hypothetical protein